MKLTETGMTLLYELSDAYLNSPHSKFGEKIDLGKIFTIAKEQSLGKAIIHFEKIENEAINTYNKKLKWTKRDDIFQNEDFETSNLGQAKMFIETSDVQNLWRLHSAQGGEDSKMSPLSEKPKWEQISTANTISIDGTTAISFSYYKIEGIIVAFYSGSSMVVDYSVLDTWMKDEIFKDRLTWRDNHSNSMSGLKKMLREAQISVSSEIIVR